VIADRDGKLVDGRPPGVIPYKASARSVTRGRILG
jgi:hypothetical protein